MQKNLLLSRGKDYWLIPRFKSKKIITINVQTKEEVIYPFLSQKEAKDNYAEWLSNSEIRLPKTFLIKAKNYDHKMIALLKKLGIKKQLKSNLKTYIFYHRFESTYNCAHIDEINSHVLPIIDYIDLKRITSHQEQLTGHTTDFLNQNKGLFANESI